MEQFNRAFEKAKRHAEEVINDLDRLEKIVRPVLQACEGIESRVSITTGNNVHVYVGLSGLRASLNFWFMDDGSTKVPTMTGESWSAETDEAWPAKQTFGGDPSSSEGRDFIRDAIQLARLGDVDMSAYCNECDEFDCDAAHCDECGSAYCDGCESEDACDECGCDGNGDH